MKNKRWADIGSYFGVSSDSASRSSSGEAAPESPLWIALRIALIVIAALVTAQLLGVEGGVGGLAVRLGLVVVFALVVGFATKLVQKRSFSVRR